MAGIERSPRWMWAWQVLLAFVIAMLPSGRLPAAGQVTASQDDVPVPVGPVKVAILEGVPEHSWDFELPAGETYGEAVFGFVSIPHKYSPRGLVDDRSNPLVLEATAQLELPSGEHRLLLRSLGAARLFVDGSLVAETDFIVPNADGHEAVPAAGGMDEPGLRPLAPGHQERVIAIALEGGQHDVRLQAFVGGRGLRPELGELSVGIAHSGEPFCLLGNSPAVPLSDAGWNEYAQAASARHAELNAARRREASAEEDKYWQTRHELSRAVWPARSVQGLAEDADRTQGTIDRLIEEKLLAAGIEPRPLIDDWAFLRRVTLDTAGVIPSGPEIDEYFAAPPAERRGHTIERLLADPRWADHWVGYWQDVLAENPGILKPQLNNTGPFRWWIHESFSDNKPMDRFATELVMMEGSRYGGAPAGFAIASQNDAPMADKAFVLAKAFLAVDLKCARCHDAPYQPFTQRDTFSLAAMLGRAPQELPVTSTVQRAPGGRQPLVPITLAAGERIEPAWPFASLSDESSEELLGDGVLRNGDDTRERLAALLTSPGNRRFAEVLVNRLWQRWLGRGLIEPVDDWFEADRPHPELLEYLAGELATHGYDLKHVARLILNSRAYQREAVSESDGPRGAVLFAGPQRRRMSAEQLVDSLFSAAGKPLGAEELNLDVEGRRPVQDFLNLGVPRRAWQFASLSNERDRPALSLPVAQGVVDLLVAFGWRESRAEPLTVRDETATVVQPLVLANGIAGSRAVRLTDDSSITRLSLDAGSAEELVERLFRQVLTRPPAQDERAMFVELLSEGFARRRTDASQAPASQRRRGRSAVSWSNHLSPEATAIKLELERMARAGEPPTAQLEAAWRERMEDAVWALVNSPEFLWVP